MTGFYSHPLHGKSITDSAQFGDRDMLFDFFERADYYEQPGKRPPFVLKNKIVKVWFYEASTRTRDMFETTIMRLGAHPIGPSDATRVSSFVKTGESIEDTMQIICMNATGIVLRHPSDDAGRRAAAAIEPFGVILLDGGSGAYQHPFQAIKDCRAFHKEHRRIDDLKIACFGDLRYARTVRSLAILLPMVSMGVELYFVSQPELRISQDIKDHLDHHGLKWHEHDRLEDMIGVVDGFYGLRLQTERFKDGNGGEELLTHLVRGFPIFTPHMADRLPPTTRLYHPMPRGPEMSAELDRYPQAAYKRQARGGYTLCEAVLESIFS